LKNNFNGNLRISLFFVNLNISFQHITQKETRLEHDLMFLEIGEKNKRSFILTTTTTSFYSQQQNSKFYKNRQKDNILTFLFYLYFILT